ncbi:MAG: lysophospholipid acyltransferase family protein [Pseudomonadota bacterium]
MHSTSAVSADPGTVPLPTISYVQPGESSPRARIIDLIERLSGRVAVERIYHQLKRDEFDPRHFFRRALELACIRYSLSGTPESAIAREGPLVLIANHPFGVVDGLILCDIAARLRGDFQILIHALLCRDSDLDPYFLPIDFRDSKEAAATNIRSKRAALATLAENGVVLVFPAGGIATRSRQGFGPLQDFPWSTFTAKLIARSGATVVPLFFHGSNSRLFHFASGVSESLRASLLLHEARNKIGRNFRVHVGEPIAHAELAHMDRGAMTRHLQELTWSLGQH